MIGFCFFLNNTLGSIAQASIWDERNSHRKLQSDAPIQLASTQNFSGKPFHSLASQKIADLNLPSISPKSIDESFKLIGQNSSSNNSWTPVLKFSSLKESALKNGATPLIILQDIHQNGEAQKNIGEFIKALSEQNSSGSILVGVEGATGYLNYAPYRVLPQQNIVRDVAGKFIEKGTLLGSSYAALTSDKNNVHYFGIETPRDYRENVQAYLDAEKERKQLKAKVEKASLEMQESKHKVFSIHLFEVDEKRDSFSKGKISIAEYIDVLQNAVPSEVPSISLLSYMEAVKMEKKLNFSLVESERRDVIDQLSRTLNEKKLNALLDLSVAFKNGDVSGVSFYESLRQLMAQNKISLSRYKNFDEYIRYCCLSETIKVEKLQADLAIFENAVFDALLAAPITDVSDVSRRGAPVARPNAGREFSKGDNAVGQASGLSLLAESKQLTRIQMMLDFELTHDEWQRYLAGPKLLSGLESFERYYKAAEKRNASMLKNFQTLIDRKKPAQSILIAGGFHTNGLAQILQKKQSSYEIYSPKITTVDSLSKPAEALSVFQVNHSPLEKLFRGEKLFLGATDGVALAAGLVETKNVGSEFRDELRRNLVSNGVDPLLLRSISNAVFSRLGFISGEVKLADVMATDLATGGVWHSQIKTAFDHLNDFDAMLLKILSQKIMVDSAWQVYWADNMPSAAGIFQQQEDVDGKPKTLYGLFLDSKLKELIPPDMEEGAQVLFDLLVVHEAKELSLRNGETLTPDLESELKATLTEAQYYYSLPLEKRQKLEKLLMALDKKETRPKSRFMPVILTFDQFDKDSIISLAGLTALYELIIQDPNYKIQSEKFYFPKWAREILISKDESLKVPSKRTSSSDSIELIRTFSKSQNNAGIFFSPTLPYVTRLRQNAKKKIVGAFGGVDRGGKDWPFNYLANVNSSNSQPLVAYSEDGTQLAINDGSDPKLDPGAGNILLYSIRIFSGNPYAEFSNTLSLNEKVEAMKYSPDGKLLVVVNQSGLINIYDVSQLKSGPPLSTFRFESEIFYSQIFFINGTIFIWGDNPKTGELKVFRIKKVNGKWKGTSITYEHRKTVNHIWYMETLGEFMNDTAAFTDSFLPGGRMGDFDGIAVSPKKGLLAFIENSYLRIEEINSQRTRISDLLNYFIARDPDSKPINILKVAFHPTKNIISILGTVSNKTMSLSVFEYDKNGPIRAERYPHLKMYRVGFLDLGKMSQKDLELDYVNNGEELVVQNDEGAKVFKVNPATPVQVYPAYGEGKVPHKEEGGINSQIENAFESGRAELFQFAKGETKLPDERLKNKTHELKEVLSGFKKFVRTLSSNGLLYLPALNSHVNLNELLTLFENTFVVGVRASGILPGIYIRGPNVYAVAHFGHFANKNFIYIDQQLLQLLLSTSSIDHLYTLLLYELVKLSGGSQHLAETLENTLSGNKLRNFVREYISSHFKKLSLAKGVFSRLGNFLGAPQAGEIEPVEMVFDDPKWKFIMMGPELKTLLIIDPFNKLNKKIKYNGVPQIYWAKNMPSAMGVFQYEHEADGKKQIVFALLMDVRLRDLFSDELKKDQFWVRIRPFIDLLLFHENTEFELRGGGETLTPDLEAELRATLAEGVNYLSYNSTLRRVLPQLAKELDDKEGLSRPRFSPVFELFSQFDSHSPEVDVISPLMSEAGVRAVLDFILKDPFYKKQAAKIDLEKLVKKISSRVLKHENKIVESSEESIQLDNQILPAGKNEVIFMSPTHPYVLRLTRNGKDKLTAVLEAPDPKNPEKPASVEIFRDENFPDPSVIFSPDGKVIGISFESEHGFTHAFYRITMIDGKLKSIPSFQRINTNEKWFSFSPDGHTLVGVLEDASVNLYSILDGAIHLDPSLGITDALNCQVFFIKNKIYVWGIGKKSNEIFLVRYQKSSKNGEWEWSKKKFESRGKVKRIEYLEPQGKFISSDLEFFKSPLLPGGKNLNVHGSELLLMDRVKGLVVLRNQNHLKILNYDRAGESSIFANFNLTDENSRPAKILSASFHPTQNKIAVLGITSKGQIILRTFSYIKRRFTFIKTGPEADVSPIGYLELGKYRGKNFSIEYANQGQNLVFKYGARSKVLKTNLISQVSPAYGQGNIPHKEDGGINSQIENAFESGRAELYQLAKGETKLPDERLKNKVGESREMFSGFKKFVKDMSVDGKLALPALKTSVDLNELVTLFENTFVVGVQPGGALPGIYIRGPDDYAVAHFGHFGNKNFIYLDSKTLQSLLASSYKQLYTLLLYELVKLNGGTQEIAEAVEKAVADDQLKKSVQALIESEIEKHPAYKHVLNYYVARTALIHALASGDVDAYSSALNAAVLEADEVEKNIREENELFVIVRTIKKLKPKSIDVRMIGDETELLRIKEEAFTDQEKSWIKTETRKFLKAIGFTDELVDDLNRTIIHLTYPLSLSNMAPATIAQIAYDPRALQYYLQLLEMFISMDRMGLGGAVIQAPDLEKDVTIQVKRGTSKTKFLAAYFHEMIHYLAFGNFLPFDGASEIVTQAISTIIPLLENGFHSFATFYLPEHQDAFLEAKKVIELGRVAAESKNLLGSPDTFKSAVEKEILPNKPKETTPEKWNEWVERSLGYYVAGYAWGLWQLDSSVNALKFVVDYGKRYLPKVRNADIHRRLTPREEVFIEKVLTEMAPLARTALSPSITFKPRLSSDLRSLDSNRWFYEPSPEPILYYVPQDIVEYGEDGARGFILQEIFRAKFSSEELHHDSLPTPEEELAFKLLYGVSDTSRFVAQGLAQYSGRQEEVERFYKKKLRIFDIDIEKERMAENPLFVQLLDGLFYQLMMSNDVSKPIIDPRVTNPKVLKALANIFPLIVDALSEEKETFYGIVKNKIWPIAKVLLDQDNKKSEEQKKKLLEALEKAASKLSDTTGTGTPKPSGRGGQKSGQPMSPDQLNQKLGDLDQLAQDIAHQAQSIETKASEATKGAEGVNSSAGKIDRTGKGSQNSASELDKAISDLIKKIKELRAKGQELQNQTQTIEDAVGDLNPTNKNSGQSKQDLEKKSEGLNGLAKKINESAAEADKAAAEAKESGRDLATKIKDKPERIDSIKGRAQQIQKKMGEVKEKLKQLQAQSKEIQQGTPEFKKGLEEFNQNESNPSRSVSDGGHPTQKRSVPSDPEQEFPTIQAKDKTGADESAREELEDLLRKVTNKDSDISVVEEREAKKRYEKAMESTTGLYEWQRKAIDIIRDQNKEFESTLRNSILNILSELQRVEMEHHRKKGKMDSRRLPLVGAGIKNIFKLKNIPDEKKLRLSLLIDVSGSMYYDPHNFDLKDVSDKMMKAKNRINNAVKVALLYLEAFKNNPNVEVEIVLFAAQQKIILPFGTKITDQVIYETIDGILNHDLGTDNTDPAGLKKAIKSLRERDRKEGNAPKIMTIIADGGIYPEDQAKIQKLLTDNTDIVFIPSGIGDKSKDVVLAYAPYGKHVKKVSDLVIETGKWLREQISKLGAENFILIGTLALLTGIAHYTQHDGTMLLAALGALKLKKQNPNTENFIFLEEKGKTYLTVKGSEYPDFKEEVNNSQNDEIDNPAATFPETPTNVNDVVKIIRYTNTQFLDRSPLLIEGEAGVGKNTKIYYAAALMKKRVRFMAMHEDITEDDLVERRGVNEKEVGKTNWVPSSLVEAMKNGDWLVVDEWNKTKPEVLTRLNQIIQSRRVMLQDGTWVQAKPGFAIIFTGNPEASGNDEKVYQVQRSSAEMLDRLRVMKVNYLPYAEEMKLLVSEFMKKRGIQNANEIPEKEIKLLKQLLEAAQELRSSYFGIDSATNRSIGRGKLIARPISTRALMNMVDHIAAYPSEIERMRSVIKKYFSYEWMNDQQKQNVEAILDNKDLLKKDSPIRLSALDKNGPRYITEKGVRYVEFDGVRVKVGPKAPLSLDEIPLDMRVSWNETNLNYLHDILIDFSLGNHVLFIGEAGTGKDTIAEYLSYLVYGPVYESLGVTRNTMVEDVIAYLGLGEGEKMGADNTLLTVGKNETGLVPAFVVRAMREGRPVIFSELPKGRPEVFAVLNNILQFGWIDLANGVRVYAKPGFCLIGTGNPATKKQYIGNNEFSGEFLDRWSAYAFAPLSNEQEVKTLLDFNEMLIGVDSKYKRLNVEFIEKLVTMTQMLREQYQKEKLPYGNSMRAEKRMIAALSRYPSTYKKNLAELVTESFYFPDPQHQALVVEAMNHDDVKLGSLREIINVEITASDPEIEKALKKIQKSAKKEEDLIPALCEFDQLLFKKRQSNLSPEIIGSAKENFQLLLSNEFPATNSNSLLSHITESIQEKLTGQYPSQPVPSFIREINLFGEFTDGEINLSESEKRSLGHKKFHDLMKGKIITGVATMKLTGQDYALLDVAGYSWLVVDDDKPNAEIEKIINEFGLQEFAKGELKFDNPKEGSSQFSYFHQLLTRVSDAVKDKSPGKPILEIVQLPGKNIPNKFIESLQYLMDPDQRKKAPLLEAHKIKMAIESIATMGGSKDKKLAIFLALEKVLNDEKISISLQNKRKEISSIPSRFGFKKEKVNEPIEITELIDASSLFYNSINAAFNKVSEFDPLLIKNFQEVLTQENSLQIYWAKNLSSAAGFYSEEINGKKVFALVLDEDLKNFLNGAISTMPSALLSFLSLLIYHESQELGLRRSDETLTPQLESEIYATISEGAFYHQFSPDEKKDLKNLLHKIQADPAHHGDFLSVIQVWEQFQNEVELYSDEGLYAILDLVLRDPVYEHLAVKKLTDRLKPIKKVKEKLIEELKSAHSKLQGEIKTKKEKTLELNIDPEMEGQIDIPGLVQDGVVSGSNLIFLVADEGKALVVQQILKTPNGIPFLANSEKFTIPSLIQLSIPPRVFPKISSLSVSADGKFLEIGFTDTFSRTYEINVMAKAVHIPLIAATRTDYKNPVVQFVKLLKKNFWNILIGGKTPKSDWSFKAIESDRLTIETYTTFPRGVLPAFKASPPVKVTNGGYLLVRKKNQSLSLYNNEGEYRNHFSLKSPKSLFAFHPNGFSMIEFSPGVNGSSLWISNQIDKPLSGNRSALHLLNLERRISDLKFSPSGNFLLTLTESVANKSKVWTITGYSVGFDENRNIIGLKKTFDIPTDRPVKFFDMMADDSYIVINNHLKKLNPQAGPATHDFLNKIHALEKSISARMISLGGNISTLGKIVYSRFGFDLNQKSSVPEIEDLFDGENFRAVIQSALEKVKTKRPELAQIFSETLIIDGQLQMYWTRDMSAAAGVTMTELSGGKVYAFHIDSRLKPIFEEILAGSEEYLKSGLENFLQLLFIHEATEIATRISEPDFAPKIQSELSALLEEARAYMQLSRKEKNNLKTLLAHLDKNLNPTEKLFFEIVEFFDQFNPATLLNKESISKFIGLIIQDPVYRILYDTFVMDSINEEVIKTTLRGLPIPKSKISSASASPTAVEFGNPHLTNAPASVSGIEVSLENDLVIYNGNHPSGFRLYMVKDLKKPGVLSSFRNSIRNFIWKSDLLFGLFPSRFVLRDKDGISKAQFLNKLNSFVIYRNGRVSFINFQPNKKFKFKSTGEFLVNAIGERHVQELRDYSVDKQHRLIAILKGQESGMLLSIRKLKINADDEIIGVDSNPIVEKILKESIKRIYYTDDCQFIIGENLDGGIEIFKSSDLTALPFVGGRAITGRFRNLSPDKKLSLSWAPLENNVLVSKATFDLPGKKIVMEDLQLLPIAEYHRIRSCEFSPDNNYVAFYREPTGDVRNAYSVVLYRILHNAAGDPVKFDFLSEVPVPKTNASMAFGRDNSYLLVGQYYVPILPKIKSDENPSKAIVRSRFGLKNGNKNSDINITSMLSDEKTYENLIAKAIEQAQILRVSLFSIFTKKLHIEGTPQIYWTEKLGAIAGLTTLEVEGEKRLGILFDADVKSILDQYMVSDFQAVRDLFTLILVHEGTEFLVRDESETLTPNINSELTAMITEAEAYYSFSPERKQNLRNLLMTLDAQLSPLEKHYSSVLDFYDQYNPETIYSETAQMQFIQFILKDPVYSSQLQGFTADFVDGFLDTAVYVSLLDLKKISRIELLPDSEMTIDAKIGEPSKLPTGTSEPLFVVSPKEDWGILTGRGSDYVRLMNVNTDDLEVKLNDSLARRLGNQKFNSFSISPDGNSFFVGYENGKAQFINRDHSQVGLKIQEPLSNLIDFNTNTPLAPSYPAWGIFHPDGHNFVGVYGNNFILIHLEFDGTGPQKKIINATITKRIDVEPQIRHLAFTRDGKYLFVQYPYQSTLYELGFSNLNLDPTLSTMNLFSWMDRVDGRVVSFIGRHNVELAPFPVDSSRLEVNHEDQPLIKINGVPVAMHFSSDEKILVTLTHLRGDDGRLMDSLFSIFTVKVDKEHPENSIVTWSGEKKISGELIKDFSISPKSNFIIAEKFTLKIEKSIIRSESTINSVKKKLSAIENLLPQIEAKFSALIAAVLLLISVHSSSASILSHQEINSQLILSQQSELAARINAALNGAYDLQVRNLLKKQFSADEDGQSPFGRNSLLETTFATLKSNLSFSSLSLIASQDSRDEVRVLSLRNEDDLALIAPMVEEIQRLNQQKDARRHSLVLLNVAGFSQYGDDQKEQNLSTKIQSELEKIKNGGENVLFVSDKTAFSEKRKAGNIEMDLIVPSKLSRSIKGHFKFSENESSTLRTIYFLTGLDLDVDQSESNVKIVLVRALLGKILPIDIQQYLTLFQSVERLASSQA